MSETEGKRKHHETSDNHPNLSLWPSYARRGTQPNKCAIKHVVEAEAVTQMWRGFQHCRPSSKDRLGGSTATTQFRAQFWSVLCGLWWGFFKATEAGVLEEEMRNLTVVLWARERTRWVCVTLLQAANVSWALVPQALQKTRFFYKVSYVLHIPQYCLSPPSTLAENCTYPWLHLILAPRWTDNQHVQMYWQAKTSRICSGRWWCHTNSCKSVSAKKSCFLSCTSFVKNTTRF